MSLYLGAKQIAGTSRLDSELPEAIDGTIYNITDTSPFSSDVQQLAITCWTQEIHTSYEEKLRN